MAATMRDASGTENGFTLVELLIVVAIIAILAAIAIPQFSTYRERAARATMISDARNVMVQEEAYFAGKMTYTLVPATLGPSLFSVGGSDFVVSKDNTMTVVVGGTGSITNSYSVTIANAASGAGFGSYTLDNFGNCSWSGGASC